MGSYDFSDYQDDGAVTLRGIRGSKHPDGKDYTFPSPSAKVGLWLAHVWEVGLKAQSGVALSPADAEQLVVDDDGERHLFARVLGDAVLQELVDDGVPWDTVRQVFTVLYRKHVTGQGVDEILSSLGKAAPNRSTRRAAKKPAGSKSSRTSTASATRTRSRASTA